MPDDNRTETNHDADHEHEHAPHPAAADYPSLLLITADPSDVALERELAMAERFEQDGDTPHLLNFENPADLRKLLTERRLEVLRSINATPPTSIRALADRLGRAASDVHDDVTLLADYNIVYFEQDGRARAPYIPYDHVTIEINVLGTDTETDRAIASG
jgi:predicted transcriptional regulator